MKTHFFTPHKRTTGRPPVVDLSAADLREIQSYYLPTNKSKREGSMLLAWVRFCESRPELAHLVRDHMPATTIPTAVRDACRSVKPLIAPARGGAQRLRHESAFVPGTMRRHHREERRLMAGERASVDDATRNTACYIPWPWGGCPCSDKYGVRLGRWQTLIVHDDASSYIPFVSSVFRWQQSYRATDAASVIYRAERDIVRWDAWAIEGGVWQAKRTLAVLGGRFISAKGRPNQKLVENYINRLWSIMAGQPGDVGRHQAEMKKCSEIYVKCRAGREDPRKHFMSITDAQEALYSAIQYGNEKRIDSRTYGSWIPQARWESDMEAREIVTRDCAEDFLILPVCETRKVRRGAIAITEEGPQGMPMIWTFAAEWLWQHEGREVTAYFDPLAEWPVEATITAAGSNKPIGKIECISPQVASKDRAIEIVKSIRNTMMTETRILSTMHTQRTIRHNQGIIQIQTAAPEIAQRPAAQSEEPTTLSGDRWSREIQPAATLRELPTAAPRITRDDLANNLSRRAQMAREMSQV